MLWTSKIKLCFSYLSKKTVQCIFFSFSKAFPSGRRARAKYSLRERCKSLKTGTNNEIIPSVARWHYVIHTVLQEFLIGHFIFYLLFYPLIFLLLPLQQSTVRFLIITGGKMIKRKSVWTMPQKATRANGISLMRPRGRQESTLSKSEGA